MKLPQLILVLLASAPTAALGVDYFQFQREGAVEQIEGKVVVEAQDGGFLVLDPAHVLWAITPDELQKHEQDEQPFASLDSQAMAERLLAEMGPGFRTHTTAHYVICYNTSPAYAEWCGALFERLYLAFRNYWRQRGLQLQDPDWPLVAVVFGSEEAFERYAQAELGDATSSIIGYYSLRTNRVTTYDLTGIDGQLPAGRTSTLAHINRLLSRPEAERTVATIIHEATHQLAFNCGLQARYADIPLWVSEGVAIYFETPDLRSSRGWRTIGGVNRVRLADFRRYLRLRPADSLQTLLASDARFRDSRTAADAYAEAWALNYFLLRRYEDQYITYMQRLSQKKPLLYDSPEDRLAEFRDAFGKTLADLDAEFVRYMAAIR